MNSNRSRNHTLSPIQSPPLPPRSFPSLRPSEHPLQRAEPVRERLPQLLLTPAYCSARRASYRRHVRASSTYDSYDHSRCDPVALRLDRTVGVMSIRVDRIRGIGWSRCRKRKLFGPSAKLGSASVHCGKHKTAHLLSLRLDKLVERCSARFLVLDGNKFRTGFNSSDVLRTAQRQ